MPRSFHLLLLSLSVLFLVFSVAAHSGHHDDDNADADVTGDVDEGHDHNLRAKPLILAKIWCLIIIFFATFVAGVSPYALKWNEGFLILGTQFSGGVFLGTAVMHFLSDANETFEDLTKKEYPFAFMLACAGYLITMLADCVISSSYLITMLADCMISSVYGKHNGRSINEADGELQGNETGQGSGYGVTTQTQYQIDGGASHHLENPAFTTAISFGYTILLVFALCFHSVFEGIAIGVAETKEDAWKALWTISLHKIFAAIAMGIALLRMIPNRPLLSCAAYAFAFAISSPVGVAIGIIIDATTQGAVADWIFSISMGLASGVFIYVAVNQLLAKGYIPQKPVKVDTAFHKFFAVVLGVGVIAVVMIWDT